MLYFRHIFFLFSSMQLAVINAVFASPQHLCPQTCCTQFGTELGVNAHTAGYSNCNSDYDSNLWHSITLRNNEVVNSGLQWQCVEYARRWLINERDYTFESIDHAYQIWDLTLATNVITHKIAHWHKYANGTTEHLPAAGDLLIYDLSQGIHGHVSVIVKVSTDTVYIAEQNYSNLPWEGSDFARALPLKRDSQGLYSINDEGIIGWMRIKD